MLSSKKIFNTLFFIHLIVILLQIGFLLAAIWIIIPYRDSSNEIFLKILDVIFLIAGVTSSYLILSSYIKKSRRRTGIRDKLLVYKKGLITVWFILLFVCLLSTGIYLLTKGHFFVYTSILLIAITLIQKPSINQTVIDLELDETERQILKNPDTAI